MILKERLSYKKGFTLIEMVIVIAVIGILMGIAFNGISSVQQNARDTRRISDLRKVQAQLELYFNKCGHYPNSNKACANNSSIGSGEGSVGWKELTTRLGEVVNTSEVPDDPVSGKQGSYVYNFSEGGLEYVIGADTEKVGSNSEVTGAPVMDCTDLYCISS